MTTPPIILGNRYRLEETIGQGGMAEVWRGTDTVLNRQVAIKRLRVDLANDPTFQARFQKEATSAAKLNHPNIVSVYDTGSEVDPGTGIAVPFIVMELVQGRTLRDLLQDGRKILPRKAFEFTGGVLDALAYSHRMGIIHRDIKPANVMLTNTGQIKVMDFGIARAVTDIGQTITQTAAVIGTAQYLSPEQARGETVDARSDLYSVGCLLYELLAGRPPFLGESPVVVAVKHVRQNPLPPSQLDPEITPEMDAIVMTALAKSPSDRYQSADEMREDINRLLHGERVAASPTVALPAAGTRALDEGLPEDLVDEEYEEDIEDEEPKKLLTPTAWILIGLLAVVLIAVGVILFNAIGGGDNNGGGASATPTPSASSTPPVKKVRIPSMVGWTEIDATNELTNLGLEPEFKSEPSEQEKGTVTRTLPVAGSEVPEGSKVTVFLSSGPSSITIPKSIVGLDYNSAFNELRAAGYTAVPDQKPAETEPPDAVKGTVVTSSPEPGSPVAPDGQITLYIATGQSPVPNLIGLPWDEAKKRAEEAGFTLEVEDYTVTDMYPEGYVVTQDPVAGKYDRTKPIKVKQAKPVPPPSSSAPPPPSSSAPPSSEPT